MKQLNALRDLERELGAEIFLVGGTVRDLVRRKQPNDLDVLVRNVSPPEFEEFLQKRGSLKLVGKSFGVYNFKPEGSSKSMEISFPRTEVSTGPGHREFEIESDPQISIEEDSNRRDFTLNAMYVGINDVDDKGRFNRNAVIDFHHGLEHIRKRLVVGVGNPTLRVEEDPLRMLRAMVLVARTGYRLEGNTFGAIKKLTQTLDTVPVERIRKELIKIIESDKPSRAFKAMARTGLLARILPELNSCVGCGQNPKYHSFPVFEHVIYALDAACELTSNLAVRFAALCHDLGKAPTRQVRPGGDGPDDVSFHNHELISTKLTFAFMTRLKFPKEFTEQVVHLVRWHQYKYDRDWSDKAVRRFIRKTVILRSELEDLDSHPQFLLRQADRMGNDYKKHLPITQKQQDFQRRIIEVYNASSAHSLRDLGVDGNDLMSEFDLPPSPLIGSVIRKLFDAVEEDPELNNRGSLLELAESLIQEARDGDSEANLSSAETS